jgi:phenylacetate-CoA ligase
MPLIRYDTGDIGILSSDSRKSENKYLAKVEGRKLDILYDTKGNLISSFPIQFLVEQYSSIIQYQIIQESAKEYTMKINALAGFVHESKLIREVNNYLGEDAIIKVEYVVEIPTLSSGKRKIMVNNYLNIS